MCERWLKVIQPIMEEYQKLNRHNLRKWLKVTADVANEFEAFLVPNVPDTPPAGVVADAILEAVKMRFLNVDGRETQKKYVEELQADIKVELGHEKAALCGKMIHKAYLFEVQYNDLDLFPKVNWIIVDPILKWGMTDLKGVCQGWTVDWLKKTYRGEKVTAQTYNRDMLKILQDEAVKVALGGATTVQQAAAQKVSLSNQVAAGEFDWGQCHSVATFQTMEDGCYYVSLLSNVSHINRSGHCFGVCFWKGTIYLCDQNIGIGQIDEKVVDIANGKMEFMRWHMEKYTPRRLKDVPQGEADNFAYIEWEVFKVVGVL